MADKSILGLFGPSPEELQKMREQQTQEASMLASRISPSYSAGFGVGKLLGGVVANIFGLEDPELKKAKDVRSIFQETLADNGGVINDRPAFFQQLGYRLNEKGYVDESSTAYDMANKESQIQQDRFNQEEDRTYLRNQRESQTNLNNMKTMEQGKPYVFAVGNRLNALIKNNVPIENIIANIPNSIDNLKAAGYDTSDLESARTPDELKAAVQGMIAYGTSANIISKEKISDARIGLKETQFKATNQLLQDKQASLEKWREKKGNLEARHQTLLESNASFDKKYKTSKLLVDDYTNQIKVNQLHINDIDKDIDRLQKSLLELQKGNVYYDNNGKLMSSSDPEIGQAQIEEFTSQIDKLKGLKASIANETDSLDGKRSSLVTEFGSSSTNGTPTTSSNAPDKSAISLVVQAINSNPTKAAYAKIKENFERMHPGAKLESYIKINPNKLK